MAGREAFNIFTDEVSSKLFHHDSKEKESQADSHVGNKEKAFNLVAGGLGNLLFKEKHKQEQVESTTTTEGEPRSHHPESAPTDTEPIVDETTKNEAYRIATTELHEKLGSLLRGNANHEAAFKLLTGSLGGVLLKGHSQEKDKGKGREEGTRSIEGVGTGGDDPMDEKTKSEAYRIASEELHDRLGEVLKANANHEAAFKLLSGALGGLLLKKEQDGGGPTGSKERETLVHPKSGHDDTSPIDDSTKSEAYGIATEELHDKLGGVLGDNVNHEAAFKLLMGSLGGVLLKKEGEEGVMRTTVGSEREVVKENETRTGALVVGATAEVEMRGEASLSSATPTIKPVTSNVEEERPTSGATGATETAVDVTAIRVVESTPRTIHDDPPVPATTHPQTQQTQGTPSVLPSFAPSVTSSTRLGTGSTGVSFAQPSQQIQHSQPLTTVRPISRYEAELPPLPDGATDSVTSLPRASVQQQQQQSGLHRSHTVPPQTPPPGSISGHSASGRTRAVRGFSADRTLGSRYEGAGGSGSVLGHGEQVPVSPAHVHVHAMSGSGHELPVNGYANGSGARRSKISFIQPAAATGVGGVNPGQISSTTGHAQVHRPMSGGTLTGGGGGGPPGGEVLSHNDGSEHIGWIVPNGGAEGGGRGGPGGNDTWRISALSGAGSGHPSFSSTIEERLKPTLDLAKKQEKKYQMTSHYLGLAINIALGLQVLVGALITGVAAAASPKGAQISTSILGGASTLIASFLARVRGSGEPETSRERAKDLQKFIRNCEATILDWGNERPDPLSPHPIKKHIELLTLIDEYRREYDALINSWNNREKPPSSASKLEANVPVKRA